MKGTPMIKGSAVYKKVAAAAKAENSPFDKNREVTWGTRTGEDGREIVTKTVDRDNIFGRHVTRTKDKGFVEGGNAATNPGTVYDPNSGETVKVGSGDPGRDNIDPSLAPEGTTYGPVEDVSNMPVDQETTAPQLKDMAFFSPERIQEYKDRGWAPDHTTDPSLGTDAVGDKRRDDRDNPLNYEDQIYRNEPEQGNFREKTGDRDENFYKLPYFGNPVNAVMRPVHNPNNNESAEELRLRQMLWDRSNGGKDFLKK